MTGTDPGTLAVADALFAGLYEFYRRSLAIPCSRHTPAATTTHDPHCLAACSRPLPN